MHRAQDRHADGGDRRATMPSSPRRIAGAMRPMIAPPGTVQSGSRV